MEWNRLLCITLSCLFGACAWGDGIRNAAALGPTHLYLVMQEPLIDTTDLSVQVTPGTVDGWTADGTNLFITMKDPLTEQAYITLRGLGPRPFSTDIIPSSWPLNSLGLAFRWESNTSMNAVFDAQAKRVRIFSVSGKDAARFDPTGRMLLEGGTFSAEADVSAALIAACQKSEQFTLECTVTTAGTTDDAQGTLVALGDNLRLVQRGKKLQLVIRTTKQTTGATFAVGSISDTQPVQVTLAYKSGRLQFYINGKPALEDQSVTESLNEWKNGALTFGGDGWKGMLEGIAFYNRQLPADEIVGNATAYKKLLDARPIAPGERAQVTVKAKVLALTNAPTPKSVEPYVHALMIFEYEVISIDGGSLPDIKVGATIRVGRWGVMQGKQTTIAREKIGDVDTLILETFADHPDLERQFTVNTLEDNYELPYLYDAKKVE